MPAELASGSGDMQNRQSLDGTQRCHRMPATAAAATSRHALTITIVLRGRLPWITALHLNGPELQRSCQRERPGALG
jgi:hypothetical protein